MSARLNRLHLAGWKSIQDATVDLRPLNVLIGANGAGKSNLVSFFRLLREMAEQRLQSFIGRSGGADSVLHYGVKTTTRIESTLTIQDEPGVVSYQFELDYAEGDRLVIQGEKLEYSWPARTQSGSSMVTGGWESRLGLLTSKENESAKFTFDFLSACRVYHFHDTSITAKVRQHSYIEDNRVLAPDGGNLAAFLFALEQVRPIVYRRIVSTVHTVAPFFGDFDLAPLELNPNNIRLNWHEKGSDVTFGPHQLSDGTLRAMALIALLLQPEEKLPPLLVIDEPELGLHPSAVEIIASLLKRASHHCQVIVATQSTTLLDHFEPQDVLVVQRRGKESQFQRLDEDKLREWLDEYLLSELWEKNVIGGGPF